jgi:predicted alpha/beta superfamily hydrolase
MFFRDGCGYPVEVGGQGDDYLNYMVNEVLPAIQLLTNDRLRISRDNLGIGGCSLCGLLACHAMWTRPNTFGMVSIY